MQLPVENEVRGKRVLTSAQLAECYDTTLDCIKQNFHANKGRYVEGKHYISLVGNELKAFKDRVRNSYLDDNSDENEVRDPHSAELKARYQFYTKFKYAKSLYLWTEKGALLHAKSLNTDKAWEVYDYLVDFYFRAEEKWKTVAPAAKPEKRSGLEVVDIPENTKIQEKLVDVNEYLIALKVALIEYNKYQCEASYERKCKEISSLSLAFRNKVLDMIETEPHYVVKAGY